MNLLNSQITNPRSYKMLTTYYSLTRIAPERPNYSLILWNLCELLSEVKNHPPNLIKSSKLNFELFYPFC